MLRSRKRQADVEDWNQRDEKEGNKGEQTIGSNSQPEAIVPVWVQVTIVVGFLFLGFASEHYNRTRSMGPFHAYSIDALHDMKRGQLMHETLMLTREVDDQLEYTTNGQRFHLIFSTDCSSYQHWQRYEYNLEICF